MNDQLLGIIEAALNYATPLPVTPEVTSEEATEERRAIHENQLMPETDSIAVSPDTTVMHEFDAYNISDISALQHDEPCDDFGFYDDMQSNEKKMTLLSSKDSFTSSESSDLVTLHPCVLPDRSETIIQNPLKSLIESSPSDSPEPKSRKRRAKNVPTEETNDSVKEDTEEQFGVPLAETKHNYDHDTAVVLSEHSTTTSVTGSIGGPEVKKKRKRNRQSNPDRTPPPQILPPCRVCDEKSSGFHYGANTCEACKGFFRRTLKKKEVAFQCKCTDEEKSAWQRGPNKNGCPACRYERCLAIGMSKNAIKIGRYTLNRKTENIKEVKSLEAMDTMIQNAIIEAIEAPSPEAQSPGSFVEGLQQSSTGDIPAINFTVTSPLTALSSFENAAQTPGSSTTEDSCMSSTESPNSAELSLKEIDTIVKTLVEGQAKFKLLEPRCNKEELVEKRSKCLERYTLKTAIFGKMTMSNKEYMDFYKTTGIQPDDRFQHMNKALQFFESRISLMVGFAKYIPGFRDIDIDDQAKLIKESRVESMIVGAYPLVLDIVDWETQTVITPWGKEFHIDEMYNILPKELIRMRYKLACMLTAIELTPQEDAVLRALVVVAPDRCDLKSREIAEAIQLKLLTCLQHLLSVRPGGAGNKMYKIFDALAKFREFSNFEHKVTRERILDLPDFSAKYQLLSEFIR